MMSSHRYSQEGGNYGIPDVTPKVLHLTQFHFVWLKFMHIVVYVLGFEVLLIKLAHLPLSVHIPHICDPSVLTRAT